MNSCNKYTFKSICLTSLIWSISFDENKGTFLWSKVILISNKSESSVKYSDILCEIKSSSSEVKVVESTTFAYDISLFWTNGSDAKIRITVEDINNNKQTMNNHLVKCFMNFKSTSKKKSD
mgnify:CR=1 FL=1